jgi:arylamine N-acetyltransferase
VSTGVVEDSAGGRPALIESVKGDEARDMLLDYAGIPVGGGGVAFLRELAAGFSRLPYENISKIIKVSRFGDPRRSMRLPAEVVADHIEKGFGGTCFSLTFLLERLLRSLGFDAYTVMADMNSGKNVHCLSVVKEGGVKYMIDPGYALYEVMELPGRVSRVTCPHAVVEVVNGGGGVFSLWTNDASGRKRRYTFEDRPVGDEDFERHWVESFFRPTLRTICLTRMTPGGHVYLRKDFYKFTSRKSIDKRKVKHDVERLIEDVFGIKGEWARVAQKILTERRQET